MNIFHIKMFSDNIDSKTKCHISDYVKSMYASLTPIDFQYNIVVTGPVSAGKTTILNALYNLFKLSNQEIQTFPEFISTPLGRELLKKNLRNEISALTLQSYVLDFSDKNPNFKNINLFERCLEDTVYVFCKYQLETGKLTDLEYKVLEEKMKQINKKWNLPSWSEKYEFSFIHVDKSVDEILCEIFKSISSDINLKIKTRIIYLDLEPLKLLERIKMRGRDGESNYDINYVKTICKKYDAILPDWWD